MVFSPMAEAGPQRIFVSYARKDGRNWRSTATSQAKRHLPELSQWVKIFLSL
jgi:hypothetical protein